MVKEFQEGTGPGALVVSIKAGGTGLNLTAASHVVLYDRWWNPAVEDQARDRAWRIGQAHTVICHRLVCPGTVDERVEEVVAGKRRIADLVLPGQQHPGRPRPRTAPDGARPAARRHRRRRPRREGPRQGGGRGSAEARPRRRTRKPKPTERAGPAFWGQPRPGARGGRRGTAPEAPAADQVRLTGDPAALLRSLGEPPLGRNPAAALHHLSIVYEEAVRTATALAAANGLLDMDELED